eukprot:TRINITY_DN58470_c0_g4_i1.p1 TRINITY_DN58470_c0_g4~~TRINITY_DN58470_c0_g4_i1.p1  ORF type:complete len:670 (+),score=121.68 TRINITY_DN58470_c0_g4_i1:67-2076(+)
MSGAEKGIASAEGLHIDRGGNLEPLRAGGNGGMPGDPLGCNTVRDIWVQRASEVNVNSIHPMASSSEDSTRMIAMLTDMQEQLKRVVEGQAEMQRALGIRCAGYATSWVREPPNSSSCPAPQGFAETGDELAIVDEFQPKADVLEKHSHHRHRLKGSRPLTIAPQPSLTREKSHDLFNKSKNAFDGLRTVHEDKTELGHVFEHAERIEELKSVPLSWKEWMIDLAREQTEMVVDSFIGFLIVLNAIFIGVSMDATADQAGMIFYIDVFFSMSFLSELVLKTYSNGLREQFCGKHYKMNTFDATLIAFDMVQLVIQSIHPDAASSLSNLPSASLFRVVRLVRIVRILRLLRHPVYQTLLMMLHGMFGGLPALCWALLLFVAAVYIVSLLCREILGRQDLDHTAAYFSNVPRAMVTTFRCSFGDCSDIGGTPLFEHISKEYGLGYSLFYCIFAFSMSIGMFNVISAIFVESTLAAATGMKTEQKKHRLKDTALWATRMSMIVRKIVDNVMVTADHTSYGKLSDNIDDIYDMEIPRSAMDLVCSDPQVHIALEELDVDGEDHEHLADILDVDENGSILVIELMQAIKRLRGNPRRSDIVRVDLACRSIQSTLKDVMTLLSRLAPHVIEQSASLSNFPKIPATLSLCGTEVQKPPATSKMCFGREPTKDSLKL